MGNSYYDTKSGPAGYGVEDTCHAEGCSEPVDRGLAYLCGNQPGDEFGEYGCGRWFCGTHLFTAIGMPDGVSQCDPCFGRGWGDEEEAFDVPRSAAWSPTTDETGADQ